MSDSICKIVNISSGDTERTDSTEMLIMLMLIDEGWLWHWILLSTHSFYTKNGFYSIYDTLYSLSHNF